MERIKEVSFLRNKLKEMRKLKNHVEIKNIIVRLKEINPDNIFDLNGRNLIYIPETILN